MRFSIVRSVFAFGLIAMSTASFAGQIRLAQSEGGSIGGSIEQAPARDSAHGPTKAGPAKASRPAAAARESAASFDGAWSVTSTGCSAVNTGQVTISGGRVISEGTVVGHVTAQGAVSTQYTYPNGLTVVSSGRIKGGTAAGSYRRSDGCGGTWRSIKL